MDSVINGTMCNPIFQRIGDYGRATLTEINKNRLAMRTCICECGNAKVHFCIWESNTDREQRHKYRGLEAISTN